MTVPGRPIIFAAILLAVALLAAAFAPMLSVAALAGDGLLVALCFWEGRRLAGLRVSVQPEAWGRLQVQRPTKLVYRIENRSRQAVAVAIRQPLPPSMKAESDLIEVQVGPGEVVRAAITVTARQRGGIDIPSTELDLRLPFGLAKRRWQLPENHVTVYPDLTGLREFDTLRASHTLSQMGINRTRLIGAGRDFDQLRDYLPDDDYRDIDWKATARHRRPMTRTYQAERSQDVLLCLDCGRMMGNPVGAGTAFDLAVDASVMLAHVSQRQGDRVGLALFGDAVERFIKPAAGTTAVNRVIDELIDARPAGVFPSYAALVAALRTRHRRRSVVFLFTDISDPQLAANLAEVLPLVSRKHLVVVVSLRDPILEQRAGGPAANKGEVYQVLAARQLASERAAHSRGLVRAGVQVLEADAGTLTMTAVNRYLTIKSRQML